MTAIKGLGTTGNGAGVVTPLDHKIAQSSGVVKTTTALVVRPGLFYAGSSSIVSGTAGMSYSVAAFTCATQRSAGAGVVFGGNDGALSVATTAAPGSNSRYDVVYYWPREYSLDGVDSTPVIGVVQGTAAASPTVPSLASYPGAIELARILVPAGVTATNTGTTFTHTAPFTCGDGGVVHFRTKTEMDLWTTALTGQLARVLASGTTYVWAGSAWKPVTRIHAEYTYSVSVANAAGGSTGLGTLTLDSAKSSADAATFFTPVSGGLTLLVAGDYSLGVTATLPAPASGRCFIDATGAVAARTSWTTPETDDSLAVPSFRAAASASLAVGLYQTTGATRTVTGRVFVDYLGYNN